MTDPDDSKTAEIYVEVRSTSISVHLLVSCFIFICLVLTLWLRGNEKWLKDL